MSSGVAVSEEVLQKFQELKLGHSLRYALFKLSADQSQIVVDITAPPSANYADFVKALPANDCRYAVFDFEYDADGGTRNKILFVVWAPDSAKIKAKMLYASSKDAVRKKLVGVGVEIQATDLAEIDRESVLEKVNRV
jgi:cofilin